MGGGGFLADIVNPVGAISRQAFGSNNAITRMTNSPISGSAAVSNYLRGGKMSMPGRENQGDVVNSLPYQGGYGSQRYDEQGRPILEDFESKNRPDGLIKDVYQTTNTLDPRAMNQARQEYLRDPGQMSKWGSMALTQAQNQGAATRAGQQAQATNQLAAQGGLRSGARERLAAQGMQAGLQGNQQTLQNIQMQDEQNRQKWLQMAPDMELKNASFNTDIQNKNIDRSLGEVNTERGYNTSRYSEAMKAWAAEKAAQQARNDAQRASETSGLFGGGGFLGLGI